MVMKTPASDQAPLSRSLHPSLTSRTRDMLLSDPLNLSTNHPKSPVAKPSTGRADVDNRAGVSHRKAILYLWVLPTSCAGLLFLPFVRLTGGGYQIVDGVLELYGGLVSFFLRRCTLLEGGA